MVDMLTSYRGAFPVVHVPEPKKLAWRARPVAPETRFISAPPIEPPMEFKCLEPCLSWVDASGTTLTVPRS